MRTLVNGRSDRRRSNGATAAERSTGRRALRPRRRPVRKPRSAPRAAPAAAKARPATRGDAPPSHGFTATSQPPPSSDKTSRMAKETRNRVMRTCRCARQTSNPLPKAPLQRRGGAHRHRRIASLHPYSTVTEAPDTRIDLNPRQRPRWGQGGRRPARRRAGVQGSTFPSGIQVRIPFNHARESGTVVVRPTLSPNCNDRPLGALGSPSPRPQCSVRTLGAHLARGVLLP
jgi:hypothetical protein